MFQYNRLEPVALSKGLNVQKRLDLWVPALAFGVLIWLSSEGIGTQPAYRLALMIAFLAWCGWVVREPNRS